MRPLEQMTLTCGYGTDCATGKLVREERTAVTWVPAPVAAGDVLVPRAGFEMRVLLYAVSVDPLLTHTYCYEAESNWTRYCRDGSRLAWSGEPFVCSQAGFVRLVVRRHDADFLPAELALSSCVDVRRAPCEVEPVPAWLSAEAQRVAARVEELRRPNDLVLLLLSDVHWAAGCSWHQTVQSLQAVADLVKPHALVQLGDLTDGLAPEAVTRALAADLLADLHSVGVPVYSCVGNHDHNYFKGNAESLSRESCAELYLERPEPWYYVDWEHHRLRAFFLDSFDPQRPERYGFADEEVMWFRQALREMPQDWDVVVFAHVPLLASMHVWSERIFNGPQVARMLRRFERKRQSPCVRAYVHGHNHADQVSLELGFPLVSVGCAKVEDFPEHKPLGSVTPLRAWGETSQELWDVLLVRAQDPCVRFVRFGAGDERSVVHA